MTSEHVHRAIERDAQKCPDVPEDAEIDDAGFEAREERAIEDYESEQLDGRSDVW